MKVNDNASSRFFLIAALGAAGCALEATESSSAQQASSPPVASVTQPLALAAPKWPGGVVPVCWTAASMARGDFWYWSNTIRNAVNASWPAVANVEFTGWGPCPTNTTGMVYIDLLDETIANSGGLGYSVNEGRNMWIGVLGEDFDAGVIPHEFGHILGFPHEMARSDFVDDPDGFCNQSNLQWWNGLGTPPDRQSIMASTGYCQESPVLSRWDIVGVRNAYGYRQDNVVSTGSALYARKLSTGDLYKRTGTTWTKIGGPGGQFVVVGSTLYGLAPDSSQISMYSGSGTAWTNVGGPAKSILRCGTMLCYVDAVNGNLYQRQGSSWINIGAEAFDYASTSTALYRLRLDGSAVDVYSGGTTWTQVGGPRAAIYATSNALFSTTADTSEIYRYSGSGLSWTYVGGPGRHFVGVGSTLYGLSPDRSEVHVWSGSGTTWPKIGNAALWIYGGASGALYATSPSSNDIYMYTGSGWTNLGQP